MAKFKIVQNVGQRKNVMDMANLSESLLRDEKKLAAVVTEYGKNGFISLFTKFGIGVDNSSGSINVTQQGIDESLIKWRVLTDSLPTVTIVDNSQLPAIIKANVPFTVSLNTSWIDEDAQLVSEDPNYVFFVSSRKHGHGLGGGFDYQLSWISNVDGAELPRKELLDISRGLNYIGNGKTEASETSQMFTSSAGYYDMYNVTQVIRHKFIATGHALSTAIALQQIAPDGSVISEDMFPFDPRTFLTKHINAVSSVSFFGRTNFDPIKRKVFNKSNRSNTTYKDIPLMAGVLEQFQWTNSYFEYNPNDSPENLMKQIDSILNERADYFRDPMGEYLIISGSGGKAVLDSVKEARLYSQRAKVEIEVTGNTIQQAGFTIDTYMSPTGAKFKVINTDYLTKPKGWISEKVSWNGSNLDKDGFDLFIVPLFRTENGQMNIRLMTKKKGGINRGLVIGSLAGMSGLYNSAGEPTLANADQQFTGNIMNNNYKIATPVDGEEWLALSEISAIVENPNDITWVKAKFA